MYRKSQHPVAHLRFEPSEDRRPVSSVLDAILGGVWLESLDEPPAEMAADAGRVQVLAIAASVDGSAVGAGVGASTVGTADRTQDVEDGPTTLAVDTKPALQ